MDHNISDSNSFMRTITAFVLICYSTVTLSPAAQAQGVPPMPAREVQPAAVPGAPPELDPLEAVRSGLRSLHTSNRAFGDKKASLRGLREAIKSADTDGLADFAAIERDLIQRHAPESILRRHREAVEKFKAASAAAASDLTELEATTEQNTFATKLRTVSDRLDTMKTGRRHQTFDPKNLPFGAPTQKTRAPKLKSEQFASIFPVEPAPGLRFAALTPSWLLPMLQASSGTPGPEYLAATEDVQITQPIRDLAAQLHNSPVEIYNWVRNNINFLPTYGSIQGSDLTLQTKQGNAFDTASLLIALLRAANIPARYAYGTVDVPVEKVMNWAGGMTSPQAALDHLLQGGVPTSGIAQGGVIRRARLEHVWVEAFVDFVPSRGARNLVPDTWVPMDPSFKQFEQVPGVIGAEQTAELRTIMSNYVSSAQTGPGGATSGYNVALMEQAVTSLKDHFADVLAANPDKLTLLDLVGQRAIVQSNPTVLSAGLPYTVVAKGPTWTTLPDRLRADALIELSTAGVYDEDGAQLLTTRLPLTRLGYGSLHITHVPATADDAAVWDSYKSSGAQEFPAYLINVRTQLKLNGTVIAESAAMPLGQDLALRVTFENGPAPRPVRFLVVSGDEIQIGIDASGLIPEQGTVLEARTDLGTAEGNLMAASKAFWTQADFYQRMLGQFHGAAVARLPSVGIFASPISVVYSFGVPRRANYHSRQMDVKLAQMSATALDGNSDTSRTVVMHTGMRLSSLEGETFEQLFMKSYGHSTTTMRLLEQANQQNIPVYNVNSANYESVRGSLQHPAQVLADVANAVGAGLEVVIPQRQQTNGKWTGSGYILMDPVTGSADYRISGGLSGSASDECGRQVEPVKFIAPDISIIIWLLFGWLVTEDYEVDKTAVIVFLISVVAIGIIAGAGGVIGVAGAAARAAAPMTQATFRAIAIALGVFASAEAAAGENSCGCEVEELGYRRGGNVFHNQCAMLYTDLPEYEDTDLEVLDVSFDGFRKRENRLYEIKTGTFYAFLKTVSAVNPKLLIFVETLKRKAIFDFYRQRVPSGLCQIEFGFGMSDPLLMMDMQQMMIEKNLADDAARVFANGC